MLTFVEETLITYPPELAGWKPIPPSPLTYKAKRGAKPAKDDNSKNDLVCGNALL